MTEEETKVFYESNREGLEMRFSYYWKYCFTYKGENNNMRINASYGGDSSDIYRYEVTSEPIKLPEKFEDLKGEFRDFTITDKYTGETFEYNDW